MARRTVPFLQESVESVYDIEEEIGRSVGLSVVCCILIYSVSVGYG